MKASQKIMVNQIGRIAVGSVTGLFVAEVYKATFKSSSLPMKIVGLIGMACAGYGIGHAIDLQFDEWMPSDDEIIKEALNEKDLKE